MSSQRGLLQILLCSLQGGCNMIFQAHACAHVWVCVGVCAGTCSTQYVPLPCNLLPYIAVAALYLPDPLAHHVASGQEPCLFYF